MENLTDAINHQQEFFQSPSISRHSRWVFFLNFEQRAKELLGRFPKTIWKNSDCFLKQSEKIQIVLETLWKIWLFKRESRKIIKQIKTHDDGVYVQSI